MADFDETKFQRDERGRFTSQGGRSKKTKVAPGSNKRARLEPETASAPTGRFKEDAPRGRLSDAGVETKHRLEGSLKDWAGRGGINAPGTAKGHSSRPWDAAKEQFGPLAGRMKEARMRAYDQAELPGVDAGKPNLTEGTHFKAKSQGDPMGKRIDDKSVTGTTAKDVADQAFRDIAQRYPNVSAYLKKVPLSEVQSRAAMAEWVQPSPAYAALDPTYDPEHPPVGYHILPVAGQYTSAGPTPEGKDLWTKAMTRMGVDPGDIRFGHANKPGDLMLAMNKEMPEERVQPGKTAPPIDDEPKASVIGEAFTTKTKTPWAMSSVAKDQRQYAVTTALHELGHHLMLHDVEASKAKHAAEAEFAEEHPDASVTTSKMTKGEKVADIVKRAYLKDSESSKGPFTGYAGASPNEWFAEAFAAFHVRPDYLKAKSPIAYKTVKKVMRMRGMQYPDEVRLGAPPLLAWGGSKRRSTSEL